MHVQQARGVEKTQPASLLYAFDSDVDLLGPEVHSAPQVQLRGEAGAAATPGRQLTRSHQTSRRKMELDRSIRAGAESCSGRCTWPVAAQQPPSQMISATQDLGVSSKCDTLPVRSCRKDRWTVV